VLCYVYGSKAVDRRVIDVIEEMAAGFNEAAAERRCGCCKPDQETQGSIGRASMRPQRSAAADGQERPRSTIWTIDVASMRPQRSAAADAGKPFSFRIALDSASMRPQRSAPADDVIGLSPSSFSVGRLLLIGGDSCAATCHMRHWLYAALRLR
jgi:hypothetical protein